VFREGRDRQKTPSQPTENKQVTRCSTMFPRLLYRYFITLLEHYFIWGEINMAKDKQYLSYHNLLPFIGKNFMQFSDEQKRIRGK